MTNITIDRKFLEEVVELFDSAITARHPHEILRDIRAALAAPATAPDERVKELEAELAAAEIAIAEYRQQCLDNAAEIARLRSESEERLQNCAALVAEVERLRKDAERNPIAEEDLLALFARVQTGMRFTDADIRPFASGAVAAEFFHGIKGTP